MATYDQGQSMVGSNKDCTELLAAIKAIKTARVTGKGTSSFNSYTPNADINATLDETAGVLITSDPFANGVKIIQHLLKEGYMKVAGSTAQQTAATNLKNLNIQNMGEVMKALTDAFTVVNYWATGTEGASVGCNGACTGYCDGSCSTGATKGTGNGSSNACTSCNSICSGSCSGCNSTCTSTCGSACAITCSGSCGNGCKGCSGNCGNNCTSGCGGCSGTCGVACGGGCYSCTGGCYGCSGCGNNCTGCGSSCSAGCRGCSGGCQGGAKN